MTARRCLGSRSRMMPSEPTYASDVAFTPVVKAIQNRRGSRRAYAMQESAAAGRRASTPI